MADPTIIFEPYSGGASGQIRARVDLATRFYPTLQNSINAHLGLSTTFEAVGSDRLSVHAKLPLTTRWRDVSTAFIAAQVNWVSAFSGSAPLPSVSLVNAYALVSGSFRMHTIQGGNVHAVANDATTFTAGNLFHASYALHTAFNDGRTSSDRNALFLLQPAMVGTGEPGMTFTMHSGIGLATPSLATLVTWVLQSSFKVTADLHPDVQLVKRVADVMGLRDLVEQVLLARAHSSVTVLGTPDQAQLHIFALIDQITLLDSALNTREATRVVATLLALLDEAAKPDIGHMLSTVGLIGTLSVDIEAYAAALSTVALLGTVTQGLLLTLALKDGLGLHGTGNRTLELLRALDDAIGMSVRLTIADDTYTAWVMGMDSKAVWTYDNFPFNSFATVGGLRLGCGPDGISRFGGTTDNGQDIAWSIRTGLTNLGDMKKKRLDCMYVGYTSNGNVGVSVITTSPEGEKVQYNYTLAPIASDVPVTNRIKLGRALESAYYAFQFAGTGPFTLDHARVLKLNTSRRV